MSALRALAAVSLLACCDTTTATPPTPITQVTFAPSLSVDLDASTRLESGVWIRDLDGGAGDPVSRGQVLTVNYDGWLSDGTKFGGNHATPGYRFRVGVGEVITGWDVGLPGMLPGGTRQLIVPPDLGYGSSGLPASGSAIAIPGNATLVFVVTVQSAQ